MGKFRSHQEYLRESLKDPEEYEAYTIALKEDANVTEYNFFEKMLSKDFIEQSALKCLEENGLEGAIEKVRSDLQYVSKAKVFLEKMQEELNESLKKAFKQSEEGKARIITDEEMDGLISKSL